MKQTLLLNDTINNEQGSTLVMALILLAVLTVMGISSINSSTTEFKIVQNEKIYLDNFYLAESAVRESLQRIESAGSDTLGDRSFPLSWLKQYSSSTDMGDTGNWSSGTNAAASSVSDADYAVVETGIAKGGSLDMTATSNLYDYIARGWGHTNNGNALIEVGYKKRH